CSSARPTAAVRGGPPLLLTRMSIEPNASSVRSTRRFRSAGFVTSPRTERPPIRSASRSSTSRRRANSETFAPSAASASAIASPMPADAPQTIAVRPLRPRSTPFDLASHLPGRAAARSALTVHARAHPHPGGDESPPAARFEGSSPTVPCLSPGCADFGPTRALCGGREDADNLAHRRRRGLERSVFVLAQVELDDLLDPTRAQLHRHAHVEPFDRVLALEVGRAGQHAVLVE